MDRQTGNAMSHAAPSAYNLTLFSTTPTSLGLISSNNNYGSLDMLLNREITNRTRPPPHQDGDAPPSFHFASADEQADVLVGEVDEVATLDDGKQVTLTRFLEVYADLYEKLSDVHSQIGEAESAREKLTRQTDEIASKLGDMGHMELEDFNAVLQIMQSNTLRAIESLNIAEKYKLRAKLHAAFQKCTPVLMHLKRGIAEVGRASSTSQGSAENDDFAQYGECPVCMTNRVGHACVPCGHTFCDACADKLWRNCFVCKRAIEQKLKIYV